MPPPIITKMIVGREASDCAIVALAMYLDKSYEDVLRAASEVDRKHKGKYGLYENEIKKIAQSLGVVLKRKKVVDFEDDYGILNMPDHVAVLRNGLVIDTNGTIWDVNDYREYQKSLDEDFEFMGIFYQE